MHNFLPAHRRLAPALVTRHKGLGMVLLFFALVLNGSDQLASAADLGMVLEAADTSSPRNTLLGFMSVMQRRFERNWGPDSLVQRYLDSGHFFPDQGKLDHLLKEVRNDRLIRVKYFDLSDIPPAILDQSAWRLSIELIEILARVPLPNPDTIPDLKAMDLETYKKWSIPGTEIRIARMADGPRAGEYLFTRETVAHIPKLYQRLKDEPRLTEAYGHMYEVVYDTPSGVALSLRHLIPPRWILATPGWLKFHLFAEPLWRWLALLVMFVSTLKLSWSIYRFTRSISAKSRMRGECLRLLPSLLILLVTPPSIYIIGEVLRVSPDIFGFISLTLWACFYFLLTKLVWDIANIIVEWIISMERIRADSTDRQLLRIATRLFSGSLGLGILVEGANRIGLPSYSIFAGLGVGGLAFALAGQQTLGNLIGSLIIMFEKPFRIGHSIQSGDLVGTVEHIGFRTAILRTKEGDVLFVPSSELIRHPIENKTLRDYWRIRRTLNLSLDASIQKIEQLRDAILGILYQDVDVISDSVRVTFIGVELEGYQILVDFIIPTSLEEQQLVVTERILAETVRAAERLGVSFARDHLQ